jgi:hypothetical protein
MKTNKVIRVTRPMRVWFRNFRTLINDIFNPKCTSHKWLRYPMYAINQEHKDIIMASKMEDMNQNIIIKEEL